MIRKTRRSQLDDFEKTANGEYIYTGDHYGFDTPGRTRGKALGGLWALYVGATVLELLGGIFPTPGAGDTFYVLLPYMLGLVGTATCLWALVQLTVGGEPLRAYVYRDTVEKLPGRTVVSLVGCLLSVLGQGVYLCLGGEGTALSYLFLGFQAVAGGLLFLGRKQLQGLHWSKSWKK
jgi:hypothetical protein